MEIIEIEEKKTRFANDSYDEELNFSQIAYKFSNNFLKNKNMDETNRDLDNEEKLKEEQAIYVRRLLSSRKFHGLNIWEKEIELQKQVEQDIILKSNEGLGPHPRLEGLKLLRVAWDYVDKTRLDATAYAAVSRNLVRLQLVLGFLITVLVGFLWSEKILRASTNEEKDEEIEKDIAILQYFVLASSLLLSATATLESLIAPKTMWRQLRKFQVALESTIWKYRARVGEYRTSLGTATIAEDKFAEYLDEWKEDLHRALKNITGTMIPGKTRDYMTTSVSLSTLPMFLENLSENLWSLIVRV